MQVDTNASAQSLRRHAVAALHADTPHMAVSHVHQRHQQRRAALVLHGKLGSLAGRSISSGPGLDVIVLSYATTLRHIIQANSADYSVDTFGHSWSPEVGAALDALYKPTRSSHERVEQQRNRALCQDAAARLQELSGPLKLGPFSGGFAQVSGVSSCERTASHLLGMQRALLLKAQHEAANGFVYDTTIVMRWDVVWHRPFALRGLDISRGAIVLPTYCTSSDPRSGIATQRNVTQIMTYRQAVCGGSASFLVVPTAAAECNHGKHRPCMADLTPLAREVPLAVLVVLGRSLVHTPHASRHRCSCFIHLPYSVFSLYSTLRPVHLLRIDIPARLVVRLLLRSRRCVWPRGAPRAVHQSDGAAPAPTPPQFPPQLSSQPQLLQL